MRAEGKAAIWRRVGEEPEVKFCGGDEVVNDRCVDRLAIGQLGSSEEHHTHTTDTL